MRPAARRTRGGRVMPDRALHATDRETRLRRSLKRLGCELVDAERGHFHIRRGGSKVNETADRLDLAGVEVWIKEHAKD